MLRSFSAGIPSFLTGFCRESNGRSRQPSRWDTNIGLGPALHEERFRELKQDSFGGRNCEGTGLGLPITGRPTKLMDGVLCLVGEEGDGSVFTVRRNG